MSKRIEQINALLTSEISKALGGLCPLGVIATVTQVETSPDLRDASVWISVLPDTDESWGEVQVLEKDLQGSVTPRLSMKYTPKFRLQRDTGASNAQRIDELLGDSDDS